MTSLIAGLAIAAPAAQAAACAGANVAPAVASVPIAKAATLCLLNHERTARGLRPLTTDPTLESVATAYSQAMVQQRFFAHVAPDGQRLEQRLAAYVAGASAWATGENLAWGEGTLATPAAIVKGWMQSPGHRANVLSSEFEEIGVGIVGGTPIGSLPTASATYTTEFGATQSTASAGSRTRVSATSAPLPAATKKARRISAKKRAQISRRCHRVARRTKASHKVRTARYDRCMRKELRAAAR